MPTTVISLVIFIAFLLPGFVFFLQRGRSPTIPKPSPLVETISFFAVSLLTNMIAALVFGLIRIVFGHHTPDIRRLILDRSSYVAPRVGYLLGWGAVILAISVGLAFLLGWRSTLNGLSRRAVLKLFPVVVDVSAWYHLFQDEAPQGTKIYIGCDMRDGVYISGYLDWYNTDTDDVPDRDLVLAQPEIRGSDQEELIASGFARIVVPARDIVRLHVSYLNEPESK